MGHLHKKFLKHLQAKEFINVSSWVKSNSISINYQMGKSCKLSFNSSNKISKLLLEIIHYDLWGPAPILSNQCFKYYVILIDDSSRYTCLYRLKKKSEFYECFLKFQRFVENHFERKIKTFQSDDGCEFKSRAFENHLNQCGILHMFSCPHTLKQNGIA